MPPEPAIEPVMSAEPVTPAMESPDKGALIGEEEGIRVGIVVVAVAIAAVVGVVAVTVIGVIAVAAGVDVVVVGVVVGGVVAGVVVGIRLRASVGGAPPVAPVLGLRIRIHLLRPSRILVRAGAGLSLRSLVRSAHVERGHIRDDSPTDP
jgi:hypothetical protein